MTIFQFRDYLASNIFYVFLKFVYNYVIFKTFLPFEILNHFTTNILANEQLVNLIENEFPILCYELLIIELRLEIRKFKSYISTLLSMPVIIVINKDNTLTIIIPFSI